MMKLAIQKNLNKSINNPSKAKMTLCKEVTKRKEREVTLIRLAVTSSSNQNKLLCKELTKRKERGVTVITVVVTSSSNQKKYTQP